MDRKLLCLILTIAMTISLLIPIAQVSAAGIPNPDQIYELTFGTPETCDPAWAYDTSSGQLIQNIYEPLNMFDNLETGKYVAAVADSWPGFGTPGNVIVPIKPGWNGSSETWLFHIRTGMPWQDATYGTVTCADVVYTFKRGFLFDHTNGPWWMLWEPLLGGGSSYDYDANADGNIDATEYVLMAADVDKVVQTNGTHVWFNLYKGGYAAFQQILAQTWSAIMSKQWCIDQGLWKGNINDYADFKRCWDPASPGPLMEGTPKAMGSGPYKLAIFNPDPNVGYYTLEKFDNYWKGWSGKHVSRYTMKSVAEWANRKAQFFSTDPTLQADFCTPNTANVPELHLDSNKDGPTLPGIRVVYPAAPTQVLTAFYYSFTVAAGSPYTPKVGTADKPNLFTDRNMRLCLNYLFNASQYIKDVFLGEAIQSPVCMPPGTLYWNGSKPKYDIDIAKAQSYLDKAWGGEVKEKGVIMRLAYNIGNTARQVMCTMLCYGLNNLLTWGPSAVVDIEPVGVPWATYLPELNAKKLLLFTVGWMADFPDPHNWFTPFMSPTGTYASRQSVVYGLDPPSMNWPAGAKIPPYTDAVGNYVPQINNTYIGALIKQGIQIADPVVREKLYNEFFDIYIAEATQLPTVSARRRHYERTWIHGYAGSFNENAIAPGYYAYQLWKEASGSVFSVDVSATETIANVTVAYPFIQDFNGKMQMKGKAAWINYSVHVKYVTGDQDIQVLLGLKRTDDAGNYFFPILKTITMGATDRDYTDEFDWYETAITDGNFTVSFYVSPSASGGNDVEDTNLANNLANEAHLVRVRTWNVDMDGTGKIDILDIFVAASSFGAKPGEKRWDKRADINGDGLVDIRDIFQIARAFGKSFTDVYHL
jgi:peptide/nickel transport system substrate-binding protein